MGTTFTRKELYDKVWLEPLSTLAPKLGISDVALGKACRKAGIPRPHRGYWAKLKADKPATKPPLPERFPGTFDTVEIGVNQYAYHSEDLLKPLPSPPTFDEDILVVRERVKKMIGKVAYHTLSSKTHPIIATFLGQDEVRVKEYKENPYSWYQPKFNTHIERRRLRILNVIFLACQKLGCKASMSTSQYDNENRKASINVGDHSVSFTFQSIEKKRRGNVKNASAEKLSLVIHSLHYNSKDRYAWVEDDELRIEKNLTQIVNEIVISGELAYRESIQWHYDWEVERRAELEEEERQKKIEEERIKRELRERRKQEAIDRLLAEATALQQAETIRTYVENTRVNAGRVNATAEEIEKWAIWAIKQADRIDPIKNPSFLKYEAID